MWNIFDVVYNALSEFVDKHNDKVEISLDVTHAFRSIPTFSVALLSYAQYMLGTELKSVHYGAFEKLGPAFRVKDLPIEKRIAPIVDMTDIVKLQQFTETANSLTIYGRVNKIGDEMLSHIDQTDNQKAMSYMIEAIKELDDCIQSSRIKQLSEARFMAKIKGAKKTLSSSNVPRPLKLLMERLMREIGGFNQEAGNANIEAAYNWAKKYDMLPQAVTIGREYILLRVAEHFEELNPYTDKKASERRKNFREYLSSVLSVSDKDILENNFRGGLKDFLDLTLKLLSDELVRQLRPKYANLGKARNHINHGKGECSKEELKQMLEQSYDDCLSILNQQEQSHG